MDSQIPEPIPERGDVAKGLRTVFNNRVAHMGLMIDRTQRNMRRAEQIERFAATGDISILKEPPVPEDDMGVNIGNEYHYHQVMPAVATPAPTPPLAVTPTAPSPLPTSPSTPDILVTPFTPKPQPATPPGPSVAPTAWWKDWLPVLGPAGAVFLGLVAYGLWPSPPEPVPPVTPPPVVQQPVPTPVDGEIGVTIR